MVWKIEDLELRRRTEGIPFLGYEPRPTHVRAFLERMASFGEAPALAVDDRQLTFRELLDLVAERVAELATHGVGRGDRVLFLSHNSLRWITGFWAVIELDAVPILGNAWWSADEQERATAAVAPAVTLVGPDADPTLARVAGRHCGDHHEDDDALVLFTSGSTGAPRGVVLSHRAVIAQQLAALAASGRGRPRPDRGPTLLSAPLFHIGGLQALLRAAVSGTQLVLSTGRFDPARILELIERHRVARWGAVPTMVSRVINHPSLGQRDVTSLERLVLGGAPIPPGLWDAARKAFPGLVSGAASMYGLSEAGGMVSYASARDLERHPGTAGRLLPCCEVRILDRGDQGVGEIAVRTPTQMTRFWEGGPGGPDCEGWLRTGDLGYVADGLLYVTGRAKDVIIRGGENVASANVEAALLRHPDVIEAAVVGLPDPDLGEVVGAVVHAAPGVDVADLDAVARRHLAYFEVPTVWLITSEPLPTIASGKVDKTRLARELRA